MTFSDAIAELERVEGEVAAGAADIDGLDQILSEIRTVADGAATDELSELARRIASLADTARRQLGEIELSLRRVGAVREAVSAYGAAVRPNTRGQFVRRGI